MKKVAILVSPYFSMLGTMGVAELLEETNQLLMLYHPDIATKQSMQVTYVSVSGGSVAGKYDTFFKHTISIDSNEVYDLIMIPPIKAGVIEHLPHLQAFVPWIKKQYEKNKAELCGYCTGTFLVAMTGLLDGKDCTTHCYFADIFKKMFPKTNMLPNEIIIENKGIYVSGGGISFINLVLFIIEKHYGKELSVMISKMFLIERHKTLQSCFAIFSTAKNHNDEYVLKAQRIIEREYKSMSIFQLPERISLNQRSLTRRFKKTLSKTPGEYLQMVKIESAKKNLELTGKTIAEVMYESGYSDQKTFNQAFKKITGVTPSEYRRKYQLNIVL